MTLQPKAKTILDIAPYVGGESKAAGAQQVIKLSSNEGPFGPSLQAVAAVQEAAKDMHRYPDGGCNALREALAKDNNINADQIVCGAGSDEIIQFLCNAYLAPGDEIVYSAHGFLMYAIYARAAGANPVSVPETDLKANLDGIVKAVTDKTKIIFLANPNNPTGAMIKKNDIRALREKLPENILLVLDAAYCEYVDDPDYSAGHELVETFDNVVVTRTFSKIYALGGLRLGWGHCPPGITDILNRMRGPFNVSSIAQAAGLASLKDTDFIERSRAHNAKMRGHVSKILREMGLTVYPSAGNFILVDFAEANRAENCRLALKEQGILVRQIGAYGLPSCLRISLGLENEMNLACEGIKSYLSSL